MANKRIGELLIEAGVITEQKLAAALAYQRQFGGRIGRILVEKKLVPEERLVRALSTQLGIPVGDLPIDPPAPVLLQLIPRGVALSYAVFPVGLRRDQRGDVLFLAMADPTNTDVIEKIRLATGKTVMPLIAGELAIESTIIRWLPAEPAAVSTDAGSGDDIPVVTGVLSTSSPGPPAPTTEKIAFGRPDGMIGADSGEDDDTMPPPVDFDNLTLAGPALLQPVSAPPMPVAAQPAPEPPAPDPPSTALAQEPELPESSELLELVEPDDQVPPPAPKPTCPACLADRLPDAKFCPHCGCSFTGAPRAGTAATPPLDDGVVVPLFAPASSGGGEPAEHRQPPAVAVPAGASAASRLLEESFQHPAHSLGGSVPDPSPVENKSRRGPPPRPQAEKNQGLPQPASREDDVDVLLARGEAAPAMVIPLSPGPSDLPTVAAHVDEPAALAGGGWRPPGATSSMAVSLDRSRSAMARVDHPEMLAAGALEVLTPRSLAADWASVAERPIVRKEHDATEIAVQRGREPSFTADVPDVSVPEPPAPEPHVAYQPADTSTAANPAPWAAFVSSRAGAATKTHGPDTDDGSSDRPKKLDLPEKA